MRFPQLTVVDAFDALPDASLAAVLMPARTQMAIVEAEHLRREPGGDMHAVGDVANGNRVLGFAWIESQPHLPRDLAVEGGNGIGAARDFQPQHGHAEL